MTPEQRHAAHVLARHVQGHDNATEREEQLAAGLLEERREVDASRIKIGDLEEQIEASAARAVAREQEHVRDIAAARGVTDRMRGALLEGASDAVRARAIEEALRIVAADDSAGRYGAHVAALAAALLALSEEHKATRARLAEVVAGVEGIVSAGRGGP